MRIKIALLLFCTALTFSCTEKKPIDTMNDDQLRAFADELAHKFIIADSHVDFPERLKDNKILLNEATKSIVLSDSGGEFDYERSKKRTQFTVHVNLYSSSYQKQNDTGKSFADSLINNVLAITSLFPDKFALANSPAEVEANFKSWKNFATHGNGKWCAHWKRLSKRKIFS